MARRSAGLLMFRRRGAEIEVLLVHPGGPFWRKKDLGAWSIPKGEYEEGEDAQAAARREFQEETGIAVRGELTPLGEIRQAGGKLVTAWAMEGDCAFAEMHSNFFEMEWPPKSGKKQKFPEVDRAEWFSLEDAGKKIVEGQAEFLQRLRDRGSR